MVRLYVLVLTVSATALVHGTAGWLMQWLPQWWAYAVAVVFPPAAVLATLDMASSGQHCMAWSGGTAAVSGALVSRAARRRRLPRARRGAALGRLPRPRRSRRR